MDVKKESFYELVFFLLGGLVILLLCKDLFFEQVFSVSSPERQLLLVAAPRRFMIGPGCFYMIDNNYFKLKKDGASAEGRVIKYKISNEGSEGMQFLFLPLVYMAYQTIEIRKAQKIMEILCVYC